MFCFYIFYFFFLFFRKNLIAQAEKKITIVLDAGHGGREVGAVGKISKEKDINLKVVLEVGKILEKNSSFKVIYTRKEDIFLEQHKRSRIARSKADIFISIHCNASVNKNANGSEIYIMDFGQFKEFSQVAKRENGVIKFEEKYKEMYPNFNKKSKDAFILFSLRNDATYQSSLKLGNIILDNISKVVSIKKKKINQDRLVIFFNIMCPSVLIELGYISNLEEEKKLNNSENIKKIASAIVDSILFFVKNK